MSRDKSRGFCHNNAEQFLSLSNLFLSHLTRQPMVLCGLQDMSGFYLEETYAY